MYEDWDSSIFSGFKKTNKGSSLLYVFSDLSLQKTMCLSHPHRKTSFTQQECEITMFRDWRVGGGQFGSQWEEILVHSDDPWIHQEISISSLLGSTVETVLKLDVLLMVDTLHTKNTNYRQENVKHGWQHRWNHTIP